MSGAKRILPLLAVLCFALFLLYGVYFNAFGANAESMMAFFGITESRQGFVMTIQSLGGIVMTVLLGLFGERLHKLYGLLAGAVLVGVAGVTIGTMPLYGNDSYGLLLVFALIGGVGYITIDLLMNGVIADVFPEKKSTLLPIVHGFYGLGATAGDMAYRQWQPRHLCRTVSGAGRGGAGVGRGILGGVPPRHAPHALRRYDGPAGQVRGQPGGDLS